MPGKLLIHREVGGLRYYLDEKAVHAGAALELLLDDGQWVVGRYEWTYREDDAPRLFVSEDHAMRLRPAQTLRWPEC